MSPAVQLYLRRLVMSASGSDGCHLPPGAACQSLGERRVNPRNTSTFPLADFLRDFRLLQALSLAWSVLREASCGFQGCRESAIWVIETAPCLVGIKCPAKWGKCCLVTIYNLYNNTRNWYYLISLAELKV